MSKIFWLSLLVSAEATGARAQETVVSKVFGAGSLKSRVICSAPVAANLDSGSYLAVASWAEDPRTGKQQLMRDLLFVNLDSIPADAVVLSASLYLFANPHDYIGNVGNPMYGNNNEAVLEMLKSSWDTATAAWEGQPSTGKAAPLQIKKTSANVRNDTVDMTAYVRAWVKDPRQNFGMVFRLAQEKARKKVEVLRPFPAASVDRLHPPDPLYLSLLANSRIYYGWDAPDSLQPRLVVTYKLPDGLQVKVYPVPASSGLTLSITSPQSGAVQLEVLDAAGQRVMEQSGEVSEGSNTLNVGVASLSNGVYWLNVRVGQHRTVKKFEVMK